MLEEFSLSFERQVPTTADLLYKGWTDPHLLLQWFTPFPWKTVEAFVEPYAGGRFEFVMQSPEGKNMPRGCGCVLIAEPGKTLCWTNYMTGGFVPQEIPKKDFGMVARIDFQQNLKGTLYRATVKHSNKKDMQQHTKMGFEPGWNAALDQLVSLFK